MPQILRGAYVGATVSYAYCTSCFILMDGIGVTHYTFIDSGRTSNGAPPQRILPVEGGELAIDIGVVVLKVCRPLEEKFAGYGEELSRGVAGIGIDGWRMAACDGYVTLLVGLGKGPFPSGDRHRPV